MVINSSADTVGGKDPPERALSAGVVSPVPDVAAIIGNSGLSRDCAGAVHDLVASVASGTASISGIEGSAVVGGRDTETHGIEEPALRAGKALSVGPVPVVASTVSGAGIVGGREDTRSVDEVIASVAASALS